MCPFIISFLSPVIHTKHILAFKFSRCYFCSEIYLYLHILCHHLIDFFSLISVHLWNILEWNWRDEREERKQKQFQIPSSSLPPDLWNVKDTFGRCNNRPEHPYSVFSSRISNQFFPSAVAIKGVQLGSFIQKGVYQQQGSRMQIRPWRVWKG